MQRPSDSTVTVPEERLDSWKEIASYLNRGARTVQRWEREEGLPVHRLHHEKLGSVYGYKSELDAWWKSRGTKLDLQPQPAETEPEPDPSIAVLPFRDLSRERDQQYFCDGIAEEIIGALSRVKRLRVASRMSSFRVGVESADLRSIGRQLGVSTVLEGSVRKSGDRLRVTVQLADAEKGYQLWSEAYDRESSDIFAIQEEIARHVAESLEVSLTPKEQAALQKAPTRDLQAYDFYLRGRQYFYGYGIRDMEYAIQLFTRATGCDSEFALAYAGLADCWSFLYLYADRNERVREQADWASARAVELDPEAATAHASRGMVHSLSERDHAAEDSFRTALRLDSNLFEAHYFFARHCFARGRAGEALRLYEAAMSGHPEDYQCPLLAAQIYEDMGQPEKAREARQRGIDIAERHLSLHPDDPRALYMGANGLVALGQKRRGREWADRALAMRPDDPMVLYNIGCIYSLIGAIDESLNCLEGAVEKGLTQRGWYENDSNLDAVRGNVRFEGLLKALK
ncbi:MAG: tetratricopeptide repeat protein [Bryobacteraceae bacterium]